jgi:hypothetical protein
MYQGGGFGASVPANVVLSANTDQYSSAMQGAAQQASALGRSIDSLQQKIDGLFRTAGRISLGITAADVATLTGATAAASKFQSVMQNLSNQNQVLTQSFGNGAQRMKSYTDAVDQLRSNFGAASSQAAQLVQVISGFERMGSTSGLAQLATTFEKMGITTGENPAALAQSVLGLGQAMGSSLNTAKGYADQLTTMADSSNTTAESLANFASQLAPLGRQLNMSQSQVTGFAAAFSKAGQDGYRAANVFSQMTGTVAQALQKNSPALQQFANLMGVSVGTFRSMSGGQQMAGLYDAIGRSGSQSLSILNNLGFDGLSTQRVISAVTQQGSVQGMINQSTGAYGNGSNSHPQLTTGQQFAKFGQDIAQTFEAFGQPFNQALGKFMGGLDKVAQAFTAMAQNPEVQALATIVGTIAAAFGTLASGLLALHGALGPFLAVLALKRSSLGAGLFEGLAGGGALGSGGRLGRRGSLLQEAVDNGTARPLTTAFYGWGQRRGAALNEDVRGWRSHGGRGRMAASRLALGRAGAAPGTMTDAAFAERNALDELQFQRPLTAEEKARADELGVRKPGIGRRGARGLARWFETEYTMGANAALFGKGKYDITARPSFISKGIQDRVAGGVGNFGGGFRSAFDTARFGSFGSLFKKGGEEGKEGEEASEVSALQRFKEGLANGATAVANFSRSLMEAAKAVEVNVAATEQEAKSHTTVGEAAVKDATATAEHTKTVQQDSVATAENSKRQSQSVVTSLGGAAKIQGRGIMGAVGSVAGGTAGLVGRLGMGAMDLAGGPIGLGLMAAMMAPTIISGVKSMFGGGNPSPMTNNIVGSGLNFTTSGVVAPVPGATTGTLNVNNPSQAALFQLTQGKPAIQNSLFKNAKANGGSMNLSVQQAAAVIGPQWGSMTNDQKQMVMSDLVNTYGTGAWYQFSGYLNQYSTVGRANPVIQSMPGYSGAQALYSGLQTYNLNTYGANAGGFNAEALGQTYGGSAWVKSLQGQTLDHRYAGKKYDFGPSSAQAAENAYVKKSSSGPFWTGTSYDLTPAGVALSNILGLGDHGGTSKELQGIVAKMGPQDGGINFTKKILSGLAASDTKTGNHDLETAMSSMGMVNGQTGNAQHDLALAFSDLKISSHALKSALDGLGLSAKQTKAWMDQDQTAPTANALAALGGPALFSGRGVSSRALGSAFSGPKGLQNFLNLSKSSTQPSFQSTMNQLSANEAAAAPYLTQGQQLGLKQRDAGLWAGRLQDEMKPENGGKMQEADVTSFLSAMSAVQQQMTSMLQTMKSYDMSMQQLAFSTQQFNQSMGWQKQAEALQVSRAELQQRISISRQEYQFNLQRTRAEADYNLQRMRGIQDFNHQTQQMIKQSAISMMDIYQQNPVEGLTSAQFVISNSTKQTSQLNQQESQLAKLRQMGLSTDSIQQLGLTSASNNQKTNSFFEQFMADPALIDRMNQAVKQRIAAAGGLATDASSMTWQETQYQFKLQLDRSYADFVRSMKRSGQDFHTQMAYNVADFARQMAWQAHDFDLQIEHSALQFHQSMNEQQMLLRESIQPLSQISNHIQEIAKQAGPYGDMARAILKASGGVTSLTKLFNDLTAIETKTAQNKSIDNLIKIMKSPGGLSALLGGYGTAPGHGGGGIGGGGPVGSLPSAVAHRMQAMSPSSGMCLSDVETAWGSQHKGSTAYAQWQAEVGHRHAMGSSGMIPGVPIWFGPQYGGGAGHVAINAGGGFMWSEDSGNKWVKKPIWSGALGWTDDIAGTPTALPLTPGFAKGAWNLAKDMVANVHKGEMIIPAKIASVVRRAVSQGAAANLRTVSQPVYNHFDNRTYQTNHSVTYTGDICVQANDPKAMERDMAQRARMSNLVRR